MKIARSTIILVALMVVGYIGYKVYQMPKFGDGEKIPSFSATLENGEAFELSDLRGQYVLLDFWGSWCGPCRVDNKNLVKLHGEFGDKKFKSADGFKIVSVAIETDKKRSLRAIKADKLVWPHHIILLDRFKSPIAKEFGVREIPTKYLIAPDGHILSVNEDYQSLKNRLSAELK